MNVRTLLSLLLALLLATPLLADDKAKKEAKKARKKPDKAFSLADGTLKRLAKADLTEEQVSKIKGLSEEYTPKVREARKKMASILTAEQKKARVEALRAAKKAGKKPSEVITSFKLTPEQKEAQEAAQKQMKESLGAYNKAVLKLLSPEQRQKITSAKKKRPEKKGAEKTGEKKKGAEKKDAEKKSAK